MIDPSLDRPPEPSYPDSVLKDSSHTLSKKRSTCPTRGITLIAWLALCPLLSACSLDRRADRPNIAQMLQKQAQAWNHGDIDTFMASYWQSPDLSFSSGGTTRWGWSQTRERYRRRYPTPERMGQLTFGDLHTRSLGDESILVLGRWHLERTPDPVGGNFSLIVQKVDGQWLIVHDHTSQSHSH